MSEEIGGPGRASGPAAEDGGPARPKRRKPGRAPRRKPAPKPAPRAKPRRAVHVQTGPVAWTITLPDASLRIVPPSPAVPLAPAAPSGCSDTGTPASTTTDSQHDPLIALSDENLGRALSALMPPAVTTAAGAADRAVPAAVPSFADGSPVSADDAAGEAPAPLAGSEGSAPVSVASILKAEPGKPVARPRLVAAIGTTAVLLALGWASAGLLRSPSGDAPLREPTTTAALPSPVAGRVLPLVAALTLPPDDALGLPPAPAVATLGAGDLALASVVGPSRRESVLAKDATREPAKADQTARAVAQKAQPKAAMTRSAPAVAVTVPAEESSFRPGRAILDFLSSAVSP